MRELRVKQEEERLKSTFEEKELKAEEDKLKQLKRERLKREKILYEREKKVLEMKEKQLWGETRTVPFELDRPWTHRTRTVARDASICRVITKYPANEEKTLARRSACTSSSKQRQARRERGVQLLSSHFLFSVRVWGEPSWWEDVSQKEAGNKEEI